MRCSSTLALGCLLLGAVACSSSGSDQGNDDRAPDAALDGPAADRYAGVIDPEALGLEGVPQTMKSYVGAVALLLAELTNTAGLSLDLAVHVEPKTRVQVFPVDEPNRTLFELFVEPRAEQLDQTIEVELSVAGHGVLRAVTMRVEVVTHQPPPPPAGLLGRFVEHLAEQQPDRGIDASTEWQALAGVLLDRSDGEQRQLLISSRWELGLGWTDQPGEDSATAYLRRRSELSPSWAGSIASLSGDPTVVEVDPPGAVWR